MPDLLTPLQTRSRSEMDRADDHLVRVETQQAKNPVFAVKSPEDALEALRSKPDHATLVSTLRWLKMTGPRLDDFNIKKPSPKAAQIIFALINDIVPDYWQILSSENSQEKMLLVQCLGSIAGIGAMTSRLRLLLTSLRDCPKPAQYTAISKSQPVETLLDLLETVLTEQNLITGIWSGIHDCDLSSPQKSLQWKELTSLVASGKLLSLVSEVNLTLGDLSPGVKAGSWVGDGSQYAAWLGRCMQGAAKALEKDDIEGQKALSQLLSKGLTLGYTGWRSFDTTGCPG